MGWMTSSASLLPPAATLTFPSAWQRIVPFTVDLIAVLRRALAREELQAITVAVSMEDVMFRNFAVVVGYAAILVLFTALYTKAGDQICGVGYYKE